MSRNSLPLTPLEKTREEERAYQAWLAQRKIYTPPPEPSSRDIVHDNPYIVRALAWAVSVIPALLALIMLTAIFISADRTFAAFQGAAAHQSTFWASIIGLLGVIFTEGSLVMSEFASVRSRLQSNTPRQVWTLPQFFRGIGVRLGLKKPLDYDEMPDTNLERFATMVFILVLAANVFVATMPMLETSGMSWAAMTDLARIKLGFAIFMGVVAPFGLKFVGAQLAQLSYSLYEQQRVEMRQEMQEQWRQDLMQMWEVDGPRIVAEALHSRYLQKNKLPEGAGSPYLLLAGEDEEGEPSVQALPLPSSWEPSPGPSPTGSPNGDREMT